MLEGRVSLKRREFHSREECRCIGESVMVKGIFHAKGESVMLEKSVMLEECVMPEERASC